MSGLMKERGSKSKHIAAVLKLEHVSAKVSSRAFISNLKRLNEVMSLIEVKQILRLKTLAFYQLKLLQ